MGLNSAQDARQLVDHADICLGLTLFADCQAYVILSIVGSLERLQIKEVGCTKITGKSRV